MGEHKIIERTIRGPAPSGNPPPKPAKKEKKDKGK